METAVPAWQHGCRRRDKNVRWMPPLPQWSLCFPEQQSCPASPRNIQGAAGPHQPHRPALHEMSCWVSAWVSQVLAPRELHLHANVPCESPAERNPYPALPLPEQTPCLEGINLGDTGKWSLWFLAAKGFFPAAGPSVCRSRPAARGQPSLPGKALSSPVKGDIRAALLARLVGRDVSLAAGREGSQSIPLCRGWRSGRGIGSYTTLRQADKAASVAGALASPRSEFPDVANISRSPLDTHLHTQAGAHTHTQAGAHAPAHACL